MRDVAPEDSGESTEVDPLVGATLNGRYQVVCQLDQGGMGSVYEGRNLAIDKRVVIKVLHHEFAREARMVERFKREARAATSIGHENIVDVTDLGELFDGTPFIVMEYLDGLSLGELLQKEGVLRVSRAVRITRQICGALSAAHAKGIVHRDMKPDNVFLVRRGGNEDFVKVLDFGISKISGVPGSQSRLTKTGVAMGTPAYMSPEQAQGLKTLDHRSDVFALGVMLFEALTGRLPFEGHTYAALLLKMMTADPPLVTAFRADVPAGLSAIVHLMMEKQPTDRPASMRELHDSLEAFEQIDVEPRLIGSVPDGLARDRATQLERSGSTERQGAHDPADSIRPPRSRPKSGRETEDVITQDELSTATTERPAAKPSASEGSAAESEDSEPLETDPIASEPVETGSSGVDAAADEALGRRSGGGSAMGRWVSFAAAGLIALSVAAWWGLREPPAVETPDPPPPVAQEVRVRIRVAPADARIRLGGTTFDNPMDAARPRSLDPITLQIDREGYRAVERAIVLDQDRSYDFELAELAQEVEPTAQVDVVPVLERNTEVPPVTGRRRGRAAAAPEARPQTPTRPRNDPPPEGASDDPPEDPPASGGVYRGRRGTLRPEF